MWIKKQVKQTRKGDWFKVEKGVQEGCILSPCLFNINAVAKSLQSCPTLCDPIDGSPPGSPVAGILQARTLEWVAISFSNAWKWKIKVKSLSRVWLPATPWTAAYQAPPSMGFSTQEYWSGVPLPSARRDESQVGIKTARRHQQPRKCRWHHSNDRTWRGTKEPP